MSGAQAAGAVLGRACAPTLARSAAAAAAAASVEVKEREGEKKGFVVSTEKKNIDAFSLALFEMGFGAEASCFFLFSPSSLARERERESSRETREMVPDGHSTRRSENGRKDF